MQARDLESKIEAELRRGVLQIATLALMRDRTYGYKLGKDLAACGLETEEGTLYPILRRLEDQGLLESSWDTSGSRPRKYYRITSRGEVALASLVGTWRRINASIRTGLLNEGSDEP